MSLVKSEENLLEALGQAGIHENKAPEGITYPFYICLECTFTLPKMPTVAQTSSPSDPRDAEIKALKAELKAIKAEAKTEIKALHEEINTLMTQAKAFMAKILTLSEDLQLKTASIKNLQRTKTQALKNLSDFQSKQLGRQ